MNQTVVQFAASSRNSVPKGTRLNDIYEIEELLAAGGMGEVYRGRLIETGDAVAIKMIKPELADNEAVLALFRKEASALHHLHHDSIVRYYVFTVDRRINRPYLAMEFVEGEPLSDILRRRPLSFDETDELRKRVGAGLQVAHDKGIIHRDISPDNIILPHEDVKQAKIIDFGIARSTKLGQATVIGDGFAGKYNYVSPEQLGLFGGEVTGRSDMYSFGLVLAEGMLGKAIDMSGSQAEVIDKRRVVPDLSGIDVRMRPLLNAMLQPKPEDRPPAMSEIVEWQPAATSREKSKLKVRQKTSIPQSPLGGEGGSKLPMIAAGVALLVAGGGAGWFFLQKPAPPPAVAVAPSMTQPVAPPPAPPVVSATPDPPVNMIVPPSPVVVDPPRKGPLTPSERAARVAAYVRYYDGGQCFLAWPTQVSDIAASVDTWSTGESAVQLFASDFRVVNGFDAKITAGYVTQAQCGAIGLLQRLDPEPEGAVSVALAQSVVKRGARVQATISGAGDNPVEAYVVNEDGTVRTVTPLLRRERGQTVLDARIDDHDASPATQKLLVTMVTAKPLTALATGSVGQPSVLGRIAEEIEGTGQPPQVVLRQIRFE